MIESVSRGEVIYVEMRDIGGENDPRFVRFEVVGADGKDVPAWVRVDERGLAIIEHHSGLDAINLVVIGHREDGTKVRVPVTIQGHTGEIQLDGRVEGDQITRVETLGKVAAQERDGATSEQQRLLAAFGD